MSDETFADVASKTVDHIAATVRVVADAVQKAAPHAWEIAVRQQTIDAYGDMVVGFLTLCILFVVRQAVVSFASHVDEINENELRLIRLISTIICLAVALPLIGCWLITPAEHILNPEYYAAIDLLERARQ